MSLNVAIIGPGRSHQGTGPYIARTFHKLGHKICGVVSHSNESASRCAATLKNDLNIDTTPHANFEELLATSKVDIAVISSPASTHFLYLEIAIDAGCHIFCEKPMWWDSEIKSIAECRAKTIDIVNRCKAKNRILQLNTQWPYTVPTFYELYPDCNAEIKSFSMWLAPQSSHLNMIIDAAPHLLSMLYSLVGTGRIEGIQIHSKSDTNFSINFIYQHAFGDVSVEFFLQSSDAIPKSAAYAINDMRVDRHVELDKYLISLRSPEKQLPVVDPLESSVKNFLSSIHANCSLDESALIDGMTQLAQIYFSVKNN